MIYIWGKPACPSCTKAKMFCENNNLPFEYLEMGKDFSREAILAEFPNARTFPQIVINGNKIGGYEQMLTYVESTNYNGTGHTL